MSKKNIIVASCLTLFVVGAVAFVWLKFFSITTPSSPYIQLQGNSDFKKAQDAFGSGQWAQAIDLYKQAIANTNDQNQKLAVYYYLATAQNINGQHIEAIPLLKQVVAGTTLPNEVRAYAAQYMGVMTINLSDSAAHDAIMAEIFKDSPYKEMRVQNDDAVSSRHLFEYASSFYPLGISETNIANWYIGDMIRNKVATTTEPGLSIIKLIELKLKDANADIERTAKSMTSSNLIPQVYARKAEVMEGLSRLGVVPKEQALQVYTDALQSYSMYVTLPGDDWFLRFRYANFLAFTYGQSRQGEVHAIVAPLHLNVSYTPITKPFFTTLGKIRLTQAPVTVLENSTLRAWRIAKVDPDFKNFLLSLGWQKDKF